MPGREGAVAVMVRWPEPGQVMPHLIRRIGAEAAAQLYQAFIGDLVAGMPLTSFHACLYALDNVPGFKKLFPNMAVREQEGKSEGRRLRGCFEQLLATHPRAVLVGSSMPDLHPRMLQSAFEVLERRDVVIGPTERGGFYLLGMRKPNDVFRGIRWGTGSELVTLLQNFERAGLDYGFFPTRQKVEQYEDLVSLRRRLLRPMAPLTHAMMQTLGIGQEAAAS